MSLFSYILQENAVMHHRITSINYSNILLILEKQLFIPNLQCAELTMIQAENIKTIYDTPHNRVYLLITVKKVQALNSI